MIPWENTSTKNMIYFTLFGTSAYSNKRVMMPGFEKPMTREELVTEYLRRGQRRFEKKHMEYSILETEWFENFMKFCQPIPVVSNYLFDKNKTVDSRKHFLDFLIQEVREYTVFDDRTLLSSEEKILRDYFGILISVVGNILKTFRKAWMAENLTEAEPCRCTLEERKEWKRRGVETYLLALTDREAYLKLAEESMRLGGRDDWERGTLHDYPAEVYRKRYEVRLIQSDYFNTAGNQTIREWMEYLAGEAWEHASAIYLMRWLRRHENSEIPVPVRQHIIQYYNTNTGSADFHLNPVMVCFAERFSLKIPKDRASELLFLCRYPPQEGKEWLPFRYMTPEELCTAIAHNLKAGIVNETVLSWHILYCTDYPDDIYTGSIARIARNQMRKKWVRQLAIRYICKSKDVDCACEQILPRMQGDMFFFVVEQYRSVGSRNLARMVWHYGERYATHKLRCDVMLVHLQDRRGIDSFLNHIEKRRTIPTECYRYGVLDAISNIRAPELMEELERFFALGLKNSFRQEPGQGVTEAAFEALAELAAAGQKEYDAVENMLKRYLDLYYETEWKREKIAAYLSRLNRLNG